MIRKLYLDAEDAIGRNIEKMVSFKAGMALGDLAEELSATYQAYLEKRNEMVTKFGHDPDPENPKDAGATARFIAETDPGYAEAVKTLDDYLLEDIDVKYTKLLRGDFAREDISGPDTLILRPFFKDPPVVKKVEATPAADATPAEKEEK